MKIEIDVPLRVNIPAPNVPVVHQVLMAIRNALDEKDKNDENSFLNRMITQLEVKVQWLSERKDLMHENEEWEAERRQKIKEAIEQEQQQQKQQP